jgi:predicted enzyme related to lactoylglutathione lyase
MEPMPVTGAHALLYTSEPDAVRSIFRDVFGWSHVDAGGGWLIFGLPPAEVGVHPTDGPAHQALSLMCDDLDATIAELRDKGVEIRGEPEDAGWGITTTIVLPGELEIMLYQARHPTVI